MTIGIYRFIRNAVFAVNPAIINSVGVAGVMAPSITRRNRIPVRMAIHINLLFMIVRPRVGF